ncbi:hypothetical protein OHB26_38015 [Nocardia sp. NBC_01503]|uniref:hypothetical protein n=1 Tax=Nocardia sp. NBC_01503 TaxID=2975997 RepID=UPI002E7B2306|nr:hypothetical protein [Nocardia sp. NBC_01503]WTL32578.1 hypothetical protein OHB26_38015 [Nocardia sp. NBC_01503]
MSAHWKALSVNSFGRATNARVAALPVVLFGLVDGGDDAGRLLIEVGQELDGALPGQLVGVGVEIGQGLSV